MARRRGKLGEYLAVDEYYGNVVYASRLKRDDDGYYAVKPLQRNLQEIASPLNDPRPVSLQRGPDYETYDVCALQTAPLFIGNTNVRTSTLGAAMQSQALGIDPGIGDMEVGCTLVVR